MNTYTPMQVRIATGEATRELKSMTSDVDVMQRCLAQRVRAKLAGSFGGRR